MTAQTLVHQRHRLFGHRMDTKPVPRVVRAERVASTMTARVLAVTRIGVGFIFLWAFVDKAFGLGYSTPSGKSWLNGGSPTKGFLSSVAAGPFKGTFHSMAGQGWADSLFMLGLLGIGVAVIAGFALRPAAIAGVVMMALMWAAEWPLAKHGAAGPTGSTNPIIDYHVVYALALVSLATMHAGRGWGFGERWERLPVVHRHRSLI